jgi:Na+-transporting methylmalonyl-CoA/oxaloacetate decarboxylase gamma subunit
MIVTGLYVMLVGMITVFAFLYLLVLIMQLVSWASIRLNKFFPEEVEVVEEVQKSDLSEIAIAIAAVTKFTKG